MLNLNLNLNLNLKLKLNQLHYITTKGMPYFYRKRSKFQEGALPERWLLSSDISLFNPLRAHLTFLSNVSVSQCLSLFLSFLRKKTEKAKVKWRIESIL